MATGRLPRRSNSATSLSKYFHELPDPDQNGTDFCNSFWGPNDRGVEVLFARMRGAVRTMEELRAFWRERIAIEVEYAKKLAKLAKLPLGTDEIGDVRSALNKLRAETDSQAANHVVFVQSMKRELERPLSDFVSKQHNHRETFQAWIEHSHKTKQTREKNMEKAREKYESDYVLIDSYTAQSTSLQGEELDKIQTKLERAQQNAQAHERDYQHAARALADGYKVWEGEWKTFCDQCQDLEEERFEFIRDNVWSYANAISTVCVSDDESSEQIRVQLEQNDPDKDMENFVKDYGTGSMISEPAHFVSYRESSKPDGPKQRMTKFSRTSARAPSTQPAPLVDPQEVEPTGSPAGETELGAGDGQDNHSVTLAASPPNVSMFLPTPYGSVLLSESVEDRTDEDGHGSPLGPIPQVTPSPILGMPTTSPSQMSPDSEQTAASLSTSEVEVTAGSQTGPRRSRPLPIPPTNLHNGGQ